MFAFTGTRKVESHQNRIIWEKLEEIATLDDTWHVGDAMGVDAMVRIAAKKFSKTLQVHKVQGNQRYDFAKRSKAMVDAIAFDNGKLYAFANKICPLKCEPCKNPTGDGSGTWLTIAYAHYLNIPIELTFLEPDLFAPEWFAQTQKLTSDSKQLSLW